MATAPKKKVLDKNGDQFFPITHINAVIDGQGSNVETILSNKQNVLVSGSNIKTINNTSLLGSGNIDIQGGGSTEITEGTWSEIKALRDNSQLNPGSWYRITDYVATVYSSLSLDVARSANIRFDILLFATSESQFSEECKAAINETWESSNHYFTATGANGNLDAWRVWYCIDNDDSRFEWADTSTGKGVIYRLIDENNNDCPYDFKGILFTINAAMKEEYYPRWWYREFGTSTYTSHWFFTFSCTDSNNFCDASVIGSTFFSHRQNCDGLVSGNQMGPCYEVDSSGNMKYIFPENLFIDNGWDMPNGTWFGQFKDNKIGDNCSFNVFGHNTNRVKLEELVRYSSICCNTTDSIIGKDCYYCNLDGTDNCSIGIGCHDILISGSENTVGNCCFSVTIQWGSHISIGNCCNEIFIYVSSYEVTIGNNCSQINTGSVSNITIGNRCSYIDVAYNLNNCTYGDGCSHITNQGTGDNRLMPSSNIRFGAGCSYIKLIGYCNDMEILSGVRGSSSTYLECGSIYSSDAGLIYGHTPWGLDGRPVYFDKMQDVLSREQDSGTVYAASGVSGNSATFRRLVASDLPNYVIYRSLPEEKRPLTFEILTAGTITWKHTGSSQTIQYSKNGGAWNSLVSATSGTSISVAAGDVVVFKGSAWPGSSQTVYRTFGGTATFEAYGNPASLKYGTSLTGTESLANYCLEQLFNGCSGLKRAPVLPATTLYTYCYWYMFANCTSLEEAPLLPATTLTGSCYSYMFYNCTNLKYVKCLATSGITTSSTTTNSSNWLSGVASSGTFYKPYGITYSSGTYGIPSGWNVEIIDEPTFVDIPAFATLSAWGTQYNTKASAIEALGISERMFDALLAGEITPRLRIKDSSSLTIFTEAVLRNYSSEKDFGWFHDENGSTYECRIKYVNGYYEITGLMVPVAT